MFRFLEMRSSEGVRAGEAQEGTPRLGRGLPRGAGDSTFQFRHGQTSINGEGRQEGPFPSTPFCEVCRGRERKSGKQL